MLKEKNNWIKITLHLNKFVLYSWLDAEFIACFTFVFIVRSCFRENCEKALEEQYLLDVTQGDVVTCEARNAHMENLDLLSLVFKKAAEADSPAEVRHLNHQLKNIFYIK